MLQDVRKLRKLSQSQLSKAADVSLKTIQHYEQGTRDIRLASNSTLNKLASVLCCSVDDLVNKDIDLEMAVKIEDAIDMSRVHKGPTTVSTIVNMIPQSLLDKLDSAEISLLIDVINASYQNGRASTGAEMIDDDTVWINKMQIAIDIKK
jgi:transcriptional regulator with XRE-family HTH domain